MRLKKICFFLLRQTASVGPLRGPGIIIYIKKKEGVRGNYVPPKKSPLISIYHEKNDDDSNRKGCTTFQNNADG